MIRTALIALFTFVVLQLILRVPLGYSVIPCIGKIPLTAIIAFSMGMIDHLYCCYIPSEQWRPWDVLAMVLITVLFCYGYLELPKHPLLTSFFAFLSLMSYWMARALHRVQIRKNRHKSFDLTQAYRNHFALSILVALLFVPASIAVSFSEDIATISLHDMTSPFDQSSDRETMIDEYLSHKYSDMSDFNAWQQHRIIEFLQDIEYIEANATFRNPAKVISDLLPQHSLASYNAEQNLIKINSFYLDNLAMIDLIEIVLHEGRHSYQFQLLIQINWKNPIVTNSPYFDELSKMYGDYLNYYPDSTEDFDKYFDQTIEIDARNFASEILPIYQHWLETPKQ